MLSKCDHWAIQGKADESKYPEDDGHLYNLLVTVMSNFAIFNETLSEGVHSSIFYTFYIIPISSNKGRYQMSNNDFPTQGVV